MKKCRNGGKGKGFTLIELLIVIAIIAILAALAIPNLISTRRGANETSAIAIMRTIVTSEETYKSRNLGAVTAGGTSGQYATIALLETAKLMAWPTAGAFVKSGYTFADVADSPAANFWSVYGRPTTANDGDRDFTTSGDGFIRSQPAGVAPATTVAAQALPAIQ